MIAPGTRLHGASVSGASVSGSAAAPVSEPRGAALIAPANMTPRPSRARRSTRPLPATNSRAADLVLQRRRTEPLMLSSLAPPVGFAGLIGEYVPLRDLPQRSDKVSAASPKHRGGPFGRSLSCAVPITGPSAIIAAAPCGPQCCGCVTGGDVSLAANGSFGSNLGTRSPMRERLVSARLARCRAPRRRSLLYRGQCQALA